MQVVGHFLQLEAIRDHGGTRDLYARSAYNRYYYGVFLTARAMFAGLDSNWSSLAHKSYPEVLKGTLAKQFRQARTKAVKAGDGELIEILNVAIQAAVALASLMEKAYGVRVVADYKPDELVHFSSDDRFSLKSIDITEAHNWGSTVSLWVRSIQHAWKQLHG